MLYGRNTMPNKWDKPIACYCRNCGQLHYGYRTSEGLAKLQCPKCGAVSVSKLMGRRHEQVDFYPPRGQEINN